MSDAGYFPLNLTVVQGDDLPLNFTFTLDGAPLDVTLWDFYLTIKSAYSDPDTSAKVKINPAGFTKSASIPGGTVDKITVNIPNASTAAMTAGTYYIDLQRVLAGIVTTLGKGQFIVEDQVTVRSTPV